MNPMGLRSKAHLFLEHHTERDPDGSGSGGGGSLGRKVVWASEL